MFSIITPTYNRAKELHKVYESIKNQTFTDCEWIIVDDGSTDDTAYLIADWQKENTSFKIIYHQMRKNQGKSYAVNIGLNLCKHSYTIIADSDDTFDSNTLADLRIIWKGIEQTKKANKIGAVWTLVNDENGSLVGEPWPKNFWQVGLQERVLNRKHSIAGEKWHCWRTEVLQKYKIYTNVNSHIGPSVTWNRINKDYDFLCVNRIHRIYWFSEDGIIHHKQSKLKIEKRNYYSTYLELNKAALKDILRYKHYRNLSFDYIKSSFIYNDNKLRLKGIRLILAWLAFLLILPKKALNKLY